MTDSAPAPASGASVTSAIETLVAEYERAREWLAELGAEKERAERRCQRLLSSIESALETLEPAERSPFVVRVLQMRHETKPLGRPARDPRRKAVLEFLAEQGLADTVTSGEIRAHLRRLGLSDASGYVGGLMATLAEDGVVTRKRMGEYIVNRRHQAIEWHRLQALRRHYHEAFGVR